VNIPVFVENWKVSFPIDKNSPDYWPEYVGVLLDACPHINRWLDETMVTGDQAAEAAARQLLGWFDDFADFEKLRPPPESGQAVLCQTRKRLNGLRSK